MKQYTKIKTFRVSEKQNETLNKLKQKYNIKLQVFIREAIREKIQRDFPIIKEKKN